MSTKSKNINNPKNKHIKTLFENQKLSEDDSSISSITIIKIDEEGLYLAVGFKSGIIKIY